ncbi:MAG: hypothetical protein ACR2RE_02170, partial [Geminicoccaceae bacterium]
MSRSESAKAKGSRFERQVAALLRKTGLCVIRSAGSEGKADLVAIGPDASPLLFIQCKAHVTFHAAEWNALLHEARTYGAEPILARLKDGVIEIYRLLSEKDKVPGHLPWEAVTI